MSGNLPVVLPCCRQHGRMQLRPGGSPEQRWCGTWYACTAPHCWSAILMPSSALLASLDEQRSKTKQLELGDAA